MRPTFEIAHSSRTFASGLLLELVAALRATRDGDLIAFTCAAASVAAVAQDLEAWSRLTGHSIVSAMAVGGGTRFLIRHGGIPADPEADRPLGERLWLYSNFDCNLRCAYCCVRSSPAAPRRALDLARVERIAAEAPPLGVRELFVTGGEPFLLPDIGALLAACTAALPTTVLTNAMLFRGRRLAVLDSLPRDRLVLQVSLDSPDARLHDRNRGDGTWERARAGVALARERGFRVRLAATLASDDDEAAFRAFLDREGVAPDDRVIRRIALRGFAESGVALSRADLVPEITLTAAGAYWHPVGADDEDFLVTREILPLAGVFAAFAAALERERAHRSALASIYHCA